MKQLQLRCLLPVAGLMVFASIARAQPYTRPAEIDAGIAFASAVSDQYQIHYAYAGNLEKPGIIFLHGTPGSWPAFEMYLSNQSLQRDYFMVSVDRPGWGKSAYHPNAGVSPGKPRKVVPEFALQARLVGSIMRQYPQKKWLLVGHSLGSSLAPKIALLEASRVSGMLLMAGSLDPKLGAPRWYNRVANTLLAKWLLPSELNYSNDEIMALRAELKDLERELAKRQIATDVVLMQGLEDRLVSPRNTQYVMKNWPKYFASVRSIELPDAGHFLPWKQAELVITTIREFKF